MLKLPATTSHFDHIALKGGLDLLTPRLGLKPGFLTDALNFECSITGGYTRIAGYERFDGQASPSAANYFAITAAVTGAINAGDTITATGFSGEVIYRNGDLVVYTRATGTPAQGQALSVGGVVQATVTEVGAAEDARDFDARMKGLAADAWRADIQAVPGSGPIRGVVYINDAVYAFRDNAGATALAVYKSTAGGWSAVPMPWQVEFTAGTSAYEEGDLLTQGATSATILRVCVESGEWSGTAAGRLILSAGGFTAGAATGGGACTLSGAATQVSLLPGGRVETDIGTVDFRRRVYGVDGTNPAFEFDGTTLVPIRTGNTPDVPTRVMVHQGHLFLAFGNSLQHSGIGAPFDWTVLAGAGEMQADDDVTVMLRLPGDQSSGAAVICSDRTTQILYGSSEQDFKLVSFEDGAGAKPFTGQPMGQALALDDAGIFSVQAAQVFGNFVSSTLTQNIQPWIQARRNRATGSLVNRDKGQYRVFFSDGSALYLTMAAGKLVGKAPITFVHPVACVCAGQSTDGEQAAFFGSTDGFVYQMDAGTSFDGQAIDAFFTPNWASQGNARQRKRYRGLTLEVQGTGYAKFGVSFELGYGSDAIAQHAGESESELSLRQAYWDAFTWDAFTWDGRSLAPTEVELSGTGENIALRLACNSALFEPFTINSAVLRYSPRRTLR